MGENFGEFGDFLRIRQSFIRQLLVISEKLGAGLKFAKVFFAKCNLASYSPKFSPAKILRYTVYYELLVPVMCQADVLANILWAQNVL